MLVKKIKVKKKTRATWLSEERTEATPQWKTYSPPKKREGSEPFEVQGAKAIISPSFFTLNKNQNKPSKKKKNYFFILLTPPFTEEKNFKMRSLEPGAQDDTPAPVPSSRWHTVLITKCFPETKLSLCFEIVGSFRRNHEKHSKLRKSRSKQTYGNSSIGTWMAISDLFCLFVCSSLCYVYRHPSVMPSRPWGYCNK